MAQGAHASQAITNVELLKIDLTVARATRMIALIDARREQRDHGWQTPITGSRAAGKGCADSA